MLEVLQLPVDSQLLVFSRASLQGKRINEQNPRALFFNDRVALGWVRGGESSKWPRTTSPPAWCSIRSNSVPTRRPAPPQFKRAFECLGCHKAGDTLGVPGLLMFSTTRPEQPQGSALPRAIDQNDPLGRRFGGWFVTGSTGAAPHMGNDVAALAGRASASSRRRRDCSTPTVIARAPATSLRTWCSPTRPA